MSKIPNSLLSSGQHIPQIGFGLWQVKNPTDIELSVTEAAKVGYRHFDSAQIYGNEAQVAEALKKTDLKREDVFITTKISVFNFTARKTKMSFEESLHKLQTDYVDLLLLHFPVTGLRARAWRDLEDIYARGTAKSIGVSNYTVRHLQKLLADCKVKPAVNQVELHVFLQQPELVEYCAKQGIVVEAYSPLAHGKGLDDPILAEIGKKHNKSSAQIMLRWCIEVGTIPLPKSVTPKRIKENFDIFDFKLDADDMTKIRGLDKGMRTCWDPTYVP
jgi:diketogulonate reductase-like aldo/keto reductase